MKTIFELDSFTEYNVLVVGAGLWGCVVARELAEAGYKVLIVEERDLPGGNARSSIDINTGIECHCYGAHIFHTSDKEVWEYINRYTAFTDYQHRVLTEYKGKVYSMPLGLTLINAFYNINLKPFEVDEFIKEEINKSNIKGEPKNLEEQAISLIGQPLYEAFIKGYTQKQWNTDPKNLPAFIIRRLPVRSNYNINYFNDAYQGVPVNGYTEMFNALLDHPLITLCCNVNYFDIRNKFPSNLPTFYSGPIDALFDFKYGPLPWRGLKFEWEIKDVQDWQGTSVMNYADADIPYTRIHEFKHFHPERKNVFNSTKTIICREYPADWAPGDLPYYPVNTDDTNVLLTKYKEEAKRYPNIIIGGRLGEYCYYDMDKVIRRALDQSHKWLELRK